MPATLNWTGGIDNLASNKNDWSPAQLPAAGDALFMSGGTMNVEGEALAGNTVFVIDPATTATKRPDVVFNIQGRATVDQNMSLTTTLTGSETFNLIGSNAVWTGGYGSTGTDVFVNGTGTWVNGMSGINGATAIIEPNVTGTGQFFVLGAGTQNGKLEFKGSVAAGQTVDVTGDSSKNTFGILQLDDPASFAGKVNLGFGEIILQGVKADAFGLQNDILTLTNAGKVVDTINLTQIQDSSAAIQPITATQTSEGLILSAHGGAIPNMPPLILLPTPITA